MAEPVISFSEDEGIEPPRGLDEFIAHNADVHFEAMDDNEWWISITVDGRTWHINCGAVNPKAKGYATCEEIG